MFSQRIFLLFFFFHGLYTAHIYIYFHGIEPHVFTLYLLLDFGKREPSSLASIRI
jgi:hypothetical protein